MDAGHDTLPQFGAPANLVTFALAEGNQIPRQEEIEEVAG